MNKQNSMTRRSERQQGKTKIGIYNITDMNETKSGPLEY